MTTETHKLSDLLKLPSDEVSVCARATWRQDGPFIVDSTGKKVALMQGEPADHASQQRRILAALNALQDIPTQFIEELLERSEENLILALITHDRTMAAALQRMEEKIVAHCREIEQLRETMEACRIFKEQRALLEQAPGAPEYAGLLRALGMR